MKLATATSVGNEIFYANFYIILSYLYFLSCHYLGSNMVSQFIFLLSESSKYYLFRKRIKKLAQRDLNLRLYKADQALIPLTDTFSSSYVEIFIRLSQLIYVVAFFQISATQRLLTIIIWQERLLFIIYFMTFLKRYSTLRKEFINISNKYFYFLSVE